MARIGSLLVNLLLEDAQFVNGLKRATKQHTDAMRAMERASNVATSALTALGAIAGSVFSVQAIQGALDYAGSIGEISTALGVSTKELQVYRFAATQVNLTNEEIEKALAKATLEIGRNNEAFAKLGISTKTAGGEIKTAGAILPELADALQKIESPAERSARLVEIFGRTGQRLGPLLEGGAAGLRTFATEAERTGQILSAKEIQEADKAADNIAKFQNAIRVSVAGAVAANAEAISGLSEAISGLITKLGNLFRTATEAKRIQAAMAAARGDEELFFGMIRKRGGAADPAKFQQFLLDNAIADAQGLGFGGGTSPAVDPPAGGGGGAGRVRAAAAKAQKELTEAQKRLAGMSEPGVLAGAGSLDETAARLREIQRIAIDIPTIKPINLEAVQLADDFKRNLVEGLGQAIVYGRNWGDAMVAAIKAAAAQLVTSGLLKLLNGGGEGGGGLFGSIIGGIGSIFGGARANGGPVGAGRAYLVGERGPEILFPGMSGTIASNKQAFGGASNVNVTVEPSDLFVTTVAVTAQRAGAEAAGQVVGRATRGRLMGARGA